MFPEGGLGFLWRIISGSTELLIVFTWSPIFREIYINKYRYLPRSAIDDFDVNGLFKILVVPLRKENKRVRVYGKPGEAHCYNSQPITESSKVALLACHT